MVEERPESHVPGYVRPGHAFRRVAGERRAWLPVALSMFTVAWGGNEFTPLLVLYRQAGEFSPVFVDLMLVAYAIGVAVGLLVTGPLTDRYGRRPIMLPAPILAVLASVIIALAEHTAGWMTIGRFLSGLAVGMAMTGGGSWVKELSSPLFDPGARPSSGAKRASMALTAGFAVGPAVAGVLAQWLPWPGQLSFGVHVVLSLVLVPLLLTIPETRQPAIHAKRRSVLDSLRVPSLRNPRFYAVVLPIAPWVFGSGFTAYATLSARMQDHVAHPLAFSGAITLLTLGVGFAIQQAAPAIAGTGGPRGPVVAMVATIAGFVGAVAVVLNPSVPVMLVACVFLGLSYGLCVYTGLSEVQRMAAPNELGALTGIFYCFTYTGMAFPALLTRLSDWFSYPLMLGFGAVVAMIVLAVVSVTGRRF
ncbi:MFS transporter [Corynebacterium sp. CCM 9203]